jgi:predicted N-acetyltransferase YhbS
MSISLRPATPEDADAAGQICHDAFADIAAQHNFPKDIPSPEFGVSLVAGRIAHPEIHGVIAEDDGRILGSNFMDERGPIFGIGPITIDPGAQNSGAGRLLMEEALQRAADQGAPGVRLLQDAYHNRSFALYTRLGFQVRDTAAVVQGASPEFLPTGTTTRPAIESDIAPCAALCHRVHGHERRAEVRDAVNGGHAQVVERDGQIAGYTTGVDLSGHSVAETNDDIQALIAATPSYPGPGFLVPTSNHALLSWCLSRGLRITKLMSLMTIGLYNEPRGAFLPSVIY